MAKKGSDVRGGQAGSVTGGGQSNAQISSGSVGNLFTGDASGFDFGDIGSQIGSQVGSVANGIAGYGGGTNYYAQASSAGASAAAAAAEAARKEAERRAEQERIAAEDEAKHRANDAKIRNETSEKQSKKEQSISSNKKPKQQDNTQQTNLKLYPIEGYEHVLQDKDRTRYPKAGHWTDEAIDELDQMHDRWLFDTAGYANEDIAALDHQLYENEKSRKRKNKAQPNIIRAKDVVLPNDNVNNYSDETTLKKDESNENVSIDANQKGSNVRTIFDSSTVNPAGNAKASGFVDNAMNGNASSQVAPQQTPTVDERTEREKADEFFQDYAHARKGEAKKRNEESYRAWRNMNPDGTRREYEESEDYFDDSEAFDKVLKSMVSEHNARIGEMVTDENGNTVPRHAVRKGKDVKDTTRQDRLIDSVVRSFKLGFFHLTTEHVDVNKDTGNRKLGWSGPVENSIVQVCEYLGMDPNEIDSQRTVFRLVMLYASMGVDRNGKMFNEGKDEWSMSEREFCDVCDMIYQSCVECGHPLAAPWNTRSGRHQLRGTEVIPSGVMPKVVAQAITGPNSRLRIDGVKPTASELIEACRVEWVTRTYPWMNANLINRPDRNRRKNKDGEEIKQKNLVAQKIAIEDMQQALARIDGMDARRFSERYDVDTTLHYKIEEYKSTDVEYASAMNGLYDAEKVAEFQREQFREMERKANENQNNKEIGAFETACNIVTAGIKTNALFWNVPIAVSAVAEKGVGDVQTDFAIRSIASRTERITGVNRMNVSDLLKNAFKTDEGHKSIDAALLILEAGGPEGLAMFSETKQPLTQENAAKFVHDNYIRKAKSSAAAKVQRLNEKLSAFQQKILTGDVMFKNKDAMNYLNALLTTNQVLIGVQNQLVEQGLLDEHAGMAMTGAELDDAFTANNNDVASFMTELIGTPAGRDALIMMRSNNIGNFNPVGYSIDKVLRNHGVTNAMITTFFDSFPKYGINFLYSITPFSRSLTYLEMKRREHNGDINAGMFTVGGSLSDVSETNSFSEAMKDPAFKAGLRMNLMFDAMSIARWSVTTIILGSVIAALGFEPPDKDEDFLNISMWKIGGEEIQVAYWLNDLTQLGLPGAYGFAAALSGYSPQQCAALAMSSLYDQIDGNVIVDFIKWVKGWDKEMAELDRITGDPTSTPSFDPSYAIMELILSAGDKIIPGAPLYRYIQNDSFLLGDYALKRDPNKTFDKSSEWAIDVGKTDWVVDPHERLIRRHSTSNWLLAAYMNFVNGIMGNPDSDKTGYFWWQMPGKERPDQLGITLAKSQEMDYTNRDGCTTDYAYEELKTDELLRQIDEYSERYGGIEQAAMNGFIITHDVRYAALNVLSNRLIENQREFDALCDSGWLPDDVYRKALSDKKARDNEIWTYIKILKNDNIPQWYNSYNVILTDYDVTYTHKDGTPALPWEYLVRNDIEQEYKYKGNHPWTLAPITFVDKSSNDIVQRGFSGETIPYWYNKGENGGTDLESIINGIGLETIPYGKFEGEELNDVLFYRDLNGNLVHPEEPTTGERALIPKKATLSDDIKNFDVTGKVNDALDNDPFANIGESLGKTVGGIVADTFDTPKRKRYPTAYSKRSYGRGSSAGSGNYNPKIYSMKVSGTHITNQRVGSTRTNPNSRNVNADRASTMYTKAPQDARSTNLRPSFSTKGSREAYKRQDI